jgi:hypothetical protein
VAQEETSLRRFHLFELEDQAWFPRVIRDAGTAFLRTAVEITGQSRLLLPPLAAALYETGERRIVDLCSGGGGPLPSLVELLAEDGIQVHAKLTDLFPNQGALELASADSRGRIEFVPTPVDASQIPSDLPGFRTLFNALHHFPPSEARAILSDAMESQQPIGAFELVARHPIQLIGMLFAPLAALVLVPRLRPFNWLWVPFTYVIPLIPLLIFWDGLVSCLRAYSTTELEALVEGLDKDGYRWEIGEIQLEPTPARVAYVIGLPPLEAA